MVRKEAEKLLMLVNNSQMMSILSEYADYRIDKLTSELLNVQTIEELKSIQFAIRELKRLKTLRDEVNNPTGD